MNINLGTVKGSIALFDRPFFSRGVKCFLELSLGEFPKVIATDRIFRPCRQHYLVLEAKERVDTVEEGKTLADLVTNLVRSAENVGVVLLKTTHSSQSREGPGKLITVEYSEVSDFDRHVSVGVDGLGKQKAVPRTVHWLESLADVLTLVCSLCVPSH